MIINKIARKVKAYFGGLCALPIRIKIQNSPSPLDIKTYDGGNQCLHPSCLYFKEGWNGYKFWLVVTPYKEMNEAIENPCIYVSNDGVHFSVCPTANPLDNITLSSECEYNSDPELVYNPDLNRVECWWRRVQTNKYPEKEGRNAEILYRSYTTDGKLWSPRERMYKYQNQIEATRGFISPSIVYAEGVYHIWVSSSQTSNSKERKIVCYRYVEGEQLELVASYKPSHSLSHITVLYEENQFKIVGFDVSRKGFPYVLYSIDCNNNLCYNGMLLRQGRKDSWDGSRLYRPNLTKVDNEYWLYYSAYQEKPSGNCHVGLLRFKKWEELLKCFIQ